MKSVLWRALAFALAVVCGALTAAVQAQVLSVDLNGDGVADTVDREIRISPEVGGFSRVVVKSGADGAVLWAAASTEMNDLFGWHAVAVEDHDGDGLRDLVVASPWATAHRPSQDGGAAIPGQYGKVRLVGSSSGTLWVASLQTAGTFGLGLRSVIDQDGDGASDVLVRVNLSASQPRGQAEQAVEAWVIVSGASGQILVQGTGLATASGVPGVPTEWAGRDPAGFWVEGEYAGTRFISVPVPGDVTADGRVDLTDVERWSLGLVVEDDPDRIELVAPGDADGSLVVDQSDLDLIVLGIGQITDGSLTDESGERKVLLEATRQSLVASSRCDCVPPHKTIFCFDNDNGAVNGEPLALLCGGSTCTLLDQCLCPGCISYCDEDGDGVQNSYDCDAPDGCTVGSPPPNRPCDPDCDSDGDGVANRHDCDSPMCYVGPGTSADECDPACDDDDDGVENRDDCDSPCHEGPRGPCCGGADPVNLTVDSNMDGYVVQSSDDHSPASGSDDEAEGSAARVGRLLFLNDDDTDGDGAPGFADLDAIVFNREMPTGFDQTGRFARVLLDFGEPLEEDSRFTFVYSAADPQEVQHQSSENGAAYVLGSAGAFRLWKSPPEGTSSPRDPADAADGGDFVASGVEYSPDTFGLTAGDSKMQLWLEAVRTTASADDSLISLNMAGCTNSDATRVVAVSLRYTPVDQGGAIGQPSTDPRVSTPSPVVNGASIELFNPRVAPGGTEFIADLAISGSVTDAASALIEDSRGEIRTLAVLINGSPAFLPAAGITENVPLQVASEFDPDSILEPYKRTSAFAVTLPGVRIQPGSNLVQLIATNTFGYSGYAERSIEVEAVSPPDQAISVQIEFWENTARVTYRGDLVAGRGSGPEYVVELYSQDGVNYSDGSSQLRVTEPPSPLTGVGPSISAGMAVSLTDMTVGVTDFNVFLVGQGTLDPGSFAGEFVITPLDRPYLYGHQVLIDHSASSVIRQSVGGVYRPMLLELVGAHLLINETTRPDRVTINQFEYDLIEIDDRVYIALSGTEQPRAFLAIDARAALQNLELPGRDRRDGAYNFAAGFGAGFWASGVSLVDGTVELFRFGWHLVESYNPVSVTLRMSREGMFLTAEDSQSLAAAWELGESILPIVETLYQGGFNIAQAYILGDPALIGNLSADERIVAEFIVEAIQEIESTLIDMDAYEAGYIVGVVTAEVAASVATAGAARVVKSTQMAAALGRLTRRTDLPNGVLDDLTRAGARIARIGALCALGAAGRDGGGLGGAAASQACKRCAGIYDNLRVSSPGMPIMEAIERTFARIDEVDVGVKLASPGMAQFLLNVAPETFVYPGGVVDLAAIPTVSYWKSLTDGRRLGSKLHIHHLVEQRFLKAVFGLSGQSALDNTPGIPLDILRHINLNGANPDAITTLFHQFAAYGLENTITLTADDVLEICRRVYTHPGVRLEVVMPVIERWIMRNRP